MTDRHITHQTQGPLEGIRVIDLTRTLAGVTSTQYLADAGADVILVEPPEGTPIRSMRGWPVYGRGKRSVVLDLETESGRGELNKLLSGADVLIADGSTDALSGIGLDDESLDKTYPRLVTALITGWGRTGPWKDLKGYEALVLAKAGTMYSTRRMHSPPRANFHTVPYASFAAAHLATHGILAALLERETSGRGQFLETDLVRGITAIDCWNWFSELVGIKWPEAYEIVEPWGPENEPRSPMLFALLTAPTKDGHWLQFAQTQPHLFRAFLEEIGMDEVIAQEKFNKFPHLETSALRKEFWAIMIDRVRERTLAEWEECFLRNRNVAAELFRSGPIILDHPQLIHDGRKAVVNDPQVGPVVQPSTLAHTESGALTKLRPAPLLGSSTVADVGTRAAATDAQDAPAGNFVLEGITIVEFGEMFAGPYASSVLADLGARVVKIESMRGDGIRSLLPFPESSGAKVMQGKESVQLDLHDPEGRRLAHELVAKADIAIMAMRAGAADRLGIDYDTLRAVNPDLVYVSAPGYGTTGPYGGRPAYAPSIGAGAGIALTELPQVLSETESMTEIMRSAGMLVSASGPEVSADGLAALAVASTMLVGVLARQRGHTVPHLMTSMLSSISHAITDWVVDYDGIAPPITPDVDSRGTSALYHLYDAAEGLVFLAAPTADEWLTLTEAMAAEVDLISDPRFATPESRVENDDALVEVLAAAFVTRSAADWESHLTKAGIGCVQLYEGAPGRLLQTDPELIATYTSPAVSPTFDEHQRPSPGVAFSRSATHAPSGCLAGEHTTLVLEELGLTAQEIADLRASGVIGGA